jgi:hypothetical protein
MLTDKNAELILNLKVENFDDDVTVRAYLHDLLITLWREGDSFSGKRPFGDSGWEYDLYIVLVQNGYAAGQYDDGELTNWSPDECNGIVEDVINYCFQPVVKEINDNDLSDLDGYSYFQCD